MLRLEYKVIDCLDNTLAVKSDRQQAIEALKSCRARGIHCALALIISSKESSVEIITVNFNEAIFFE